MTQAVDYEYWNDFLFREGAVCSPAELHGVLCATQCVKNDAWFEIVLNVLDVPTEQASPALRAALEALEEIVGNVFQDQNYSFKLTLPDDALPIKDRLQALVDWCQGFLHGFGNLGELTAKRLDEEGREALTDLAKIAELDTQTEDSEENEAHYYELVEYVRVVVITLYNQFNPSQSSQSSIN